MGEEIELVTANGPEHSKEVWTHGEDGKTIYMVEVDGVKGGTVLKVGELKGLQTLLNKEARAFRRGERDLEIVMSKQELSRRRGKGSGDVL